MGRFQVNACYPAKAGDRQLHCAIGRKLNLISGLIFFTKLAVQQTA